MSKRDFLFYTVVIVFIATSIVALLGLVNVIAIDKDYLVPLVGSLLIQSGVVVFTLLKGEGKELFEDRKRQVKDLEKKNKELQEQVKELQNKTIGSDAEHNQSCSECETNKSQLDEKSEQLKKYEGLTTAIGGLLSGGTSFTLDSVMKELPGHDKADILRVLNFLVKEGVAKGSAGYWSQST
ncbi:bZIP transcription factor [Vibrio sp. THAF190c]|uniref:bZIP transcription factor n=1 Tax=Vibrio sp. THAF190c TaxID=2587865 RepID=UPI0012697D98|nr:hypothetical protein [Vibrio sp. THAF190c]